MGPYALYTRKQIEGSNDSTWDILDAKREMRTFPDATHIVFIRRGCLKLNWQELLPKGYIGYVRARQSSRKLVRLGTCDLFGRTMTLEKLRKILCVDEQK